MIKLKSNIKKGFTLVELLVSISILSIAILATFTAISNNFKSSNFAQDQTSAYYLADEAIELLRNIRDENGIKNIEKFGSNSTPISWLSGIASVASDPCYNKVCIVDSPNKIITACSGNASTCPVLRKESSSNLYGYTASWTATPFNRNISITIISATEVKVDVTVSWVTKGVSKSYVLNEILKNWQ